MRRSVLAALTLGLSLSSGFSADPAAATGEKASVELKDRDGKSLGTMNIIGTAAGALLRVKLAGLPPGPHGFHFHEAGKCEGDFATAGEIYNPLGSVHGFLNEDGPMAGDLPNLFVDASGQIEVELLSPFITLSKDAEESIFDTDGTSLVIFEKADDYLSESNGNAGERIACGVVPASK
jgi:Cu-Zn family superoxide dismutase